MSLPHEIERALKAADEYLAAAQRRDPRGRAARIRRHYPTPARVEQMMAALAQASRISAALASGAAFKATNQRGYFVPAEVLRGP